MGRPLKIQKQGYNSGVKKDAGFPAFGNVNHGTAVIPVGMTASQFLGVVGGANALGGNSIASSQFPVVAITANVNGQQGNAYIITQKGQTKYLVSGEDTVYANALAQGFSYQITNLGTGTNWTALGAGVNPQPGQVFTCALPLGQGTGNGTASDAGQCVLVTSNTLSSGQMNMSFETGGANVYASRLTNKYIWDASNNRYAVNFFAPEQAAVIANVNITSNAGVFTSNAYSGYTVGGTITVAGTLTGNATGNISGYSNPTAYYIISTDGSSTFTLSATAGGANITTTAGNTTGLLFTAEGAAATTVKSGADVATWSGNSGNITLAQVNNYTS
jgi:hypothetical protein